jgi:hypothetical protein
MAQPQPGGIEKPAGRVILQAPAFNSKHRACPKSSAAPRFRESCSGLSRLEQATTRKFSYVDLQAKANAKPAGSFGSGFLNLADLLSGVQTLQKVRFKIGEGLVQLGRKDPPLKEARPDRVDGIKVGMAFAKLHILHGTVGGGQPPSQFVPEDTKIAEYPSSAAIAVQPDGTGRFPVPHATGMGTNGCDFARCW